MDHSLVDTLYSAVPQGWREQFIPAAPNYCDNMYFEGLLCDVNAKILYRYFE